ncbi:hypothetical protein Dsin_001983 [Dipteronia sinensis]|uniref:Uncharacterized protein n=1 Tax=Dipteronia sinensis TaxID=43782 RepID=A0AAE0B5A3_9ROSI|nr:hypothetical protein Dsin_001983 [Dipteronia sinensis]
MLIYLTTLNLARFLIVKAPKANSGDELDVQTRCIAKTDKELWESLDRTRKAEDIGSKRFVVGQFLDYKMADSKSFK